MDTPKHQLRCATLLTNERNNQNVKSDFTLENSVTRMCLNVTQWLCLWYPWQICFIMMIADVLAPVWRQDICNHHDEAYSSFGKSWYKSPFWSSQYCLHRSRNRELKWSGGWSTGTVGWLSASERGHDLEGWPAMNTKCLIPLPFLPDLILWSTENRSHGSPVLVPPETQ